MPSVPDVKPGRFAHRLLPPHVHTLHSRRRRADTKTVEQGLDRGPVALDQHLDRPIIEVPDPSLQPLLQGCALRERPVRDALHAAAHQNPRPCGVTVFITRSHMMQRTTDATNNRHAPASIDGLKDATGEENDRLSEVYDFGRVGVSNTSSSCS